MGILSWFRKEPPEDYEQVLSNLATSISSRQTRLSEIRLRERRASLWATIYTLAGWAIYFFIWYLDLVPRLFHNRTRSNLQIEKVLKVAPVVIGPIATIFLRRIVQSWYTRKENAEEATLKKLLAEQRTKIEELKKKTNYYSTRNLLDRYDASPAKAGAPQTPAPPGALREGNSQLKQRPQGPQGRKSLAASQLGPKTPQRAPGDQPPNTQNQNAPNSPFVATPPRPTQRQWFDKVADALLGPDDGGSTLDPSRSRYALICGRCSAHNGLVLESMWEDTQYICPKCGHFNPAPRTLRKQRSQSHLREEMNRSRSFSPDEREDDQQPLGGRLPKPDFLGVSQSDRSVSRGRSTADGEEGENVGDVSGVGNMELDD